MFWRKGKRVVKRLDMFKFDRVEIIEVSRYNSKTATIKMRIKGVEVVKVCYRDHANYWAINGIELDAGASRKLGQLITGLNYDENGYASLVE